MLSIDVPIIVFQIENLDKPINIGIPKTTENYKSHRVDIRISTVETLSTQIT